MGRKGKVEENRQNEKYKKTMKKKRKQMKGL